MPLAITVDLVTGSYDAGADDRTRLEWPPHPARLFCALVAAARANEEWSALRWLERRAAPLVLAAGDFSASRSSSFVVTNRLAVRGGSQSHPGRTCLWRTRARVFPIASSVTFVWAAEANEDLLARLDGLCRRVPYLGRATGVVTVSASLLGSVDGKADGRLAVFEPCEDVDGVLLRVPYPGYVEELQELHEAGQPSWQAVRYQYYRRRPDGAAIPPESTSCRAVYRDVMVFTFDGLRPEGRLVCRFTAALRGAVLRSAGTAAPAVLHGHGADGQPHVAFLGLPDVSDWRSPGRHADGHLLGLAVAVPDLPEEERRSIVAAVLGLRNAENRPDEGAVELDVAGVGRVRLRYAAALDRPWGATAERWRRASRTWVSATPVLLDRFPRHDRTEEVGAIVRGSVRQAGMPEPVGVEVSMGPLLPGSVGLRNVDLPRKFGHRLFRHVVLDFDTPVPGPVLLGAGRYLGLGLLAPVQSGGTP